MCARNASSSHLFFGESKRVIVACDELTHQSGFRFRVSAFGTYGASFSVRAFSIRRSVHSECANLGASRFHMNIANIVARFIFRLRVSVDAAEFVGTCFPFSQCYVLFRSFSSTSPCLC